MVKDFAHLHVHTEFSLLDGLGAITDAKTQRGIPGYVDRAASLGMYALAITDHGNICGAPEFYHACRKANVEPLIGEEFYFVRDVAARIKRKDPNPDADKFHVVIIAKGLRGYEVLAELSTEANRHFYGKPIIDHNVCEALGDDKQHLTVLSGCANSIISKKVLEEGMESAERELLWWREEWPNFYIELQHHGTEFDRKLNKGLLRLARKYSIPWVITNDPHFVVPEDDCHHDALLAIQTASNIDDPDRFRFDGHGYHLRDRFEMAAAFKRYGEDVWKPGARNTLRIAKACHTRIPSWEKRTWQIPTYPKCPPDTTPRKLLRRLALRELRRRGWDERPEYVERFDEEIATYKEAGIENFMLITMDLCQEAVRRGIRIGPGRGSVCGSLLALLLGIHKIDPIKYDLLFERFLNPARPRMPDVDTDLAQSRRDEMYDYARELYGEENVVHVAAYARMQVKAAFQQLAKSYGIPYTDSIRISKALSNAQEDDYDLPEIITRGYPELAEQITRLAGVKRSFQNHPAGIVIAAPEAELRKQVPQMWLPSSKRWVGQYDLDAIEELGLLKEDLLGLRTLDTIDWCVEFIRQSTGETIEPDDWVPDEEDGDKKVYKMLAKGRTAGVFQMEGPTNQRGIRDIRCKEFEDIVSCTALYRTGAISAGFPKIFLANRKKGSIEYIHPALEPILGHTWGVVLYQEQVMEMGRQLAGFDMVQVDDIKEAIKHKKSNLMDQMMKTFIKGCIRVTGMTKTQAKECARYIRGYAGYGYNRSHAVAYSITTYQTARLKCFYPHEFWSAHLRTVDQSTDGGKEKRDIYCREATEDGFKLLPPDINLSDWGALPEGENGIRFGLTDFAGIGAKAAQRLLDARETLPGGKFSDPAEVAAASASNVYTILGDGGALESIGVPGIRERQEALLRWQFRDPMRKYRLKYAHLVNLPDDRTEDEDVTLVGMIYAVTNGKTKNDKDYRTWKVRWSTTQAFDIRLWSETKIYWGLQPGSVVMVRGTWEPKWLNVSVGDARRIKVIRRVEAGA